MRRIALSVLAYVLTLPLLGVASAHEEGDWIIRVGAHNIDPKSNNSPVVNVGSEVQLTFDFTYMITDRVGVEILAAAPFEHDLRLTDGTLVATVEHLPPTISLQYRWGENNVQPFFGAGINYTAFNSETTLGPIAGGNLKLDSSIGLAFQLGVDFHFSDSMLFTIVARKIDIDSDARLNGSLLTKAKIDPTAIGASIGWKF